MTTLDVHFTGLNTAGEEIGGIFAFWLDGFSLKKILAEKLKPADPWPSWEAVVSVDEIKQFVLEHPNVWQTNSDTFNANISALLEKSILIRVLVQEA